jgi:hypothetical protein
MAFVLLTLTEVSRGIEPCKGLLEIGHVQTYGGRMAGHGRAGMAKVRVPAAAEAVAELLNSRPHASPTLPDTLGDPDGVRAILAAVGLPDAEEPTSQQLDLLRTLRADLVAVLPMPVGDSGQGGAAQGWKDLSAHLSGVTFRPDFSPEGERLRQVTGDRLAGRIAVAVAELVRDGAWSRLRVCGNSECCRVFYDSTRSRTQRWHSYELCGNRSNVAAYRARKGTSGTAVGRAVSTAENG